MNFFSRMLAHALTSVRGGPCHSRHPLDIAPGGGPGTRKTSESSYHARARAVRVATAPQAPPQPITPQRTRVIAHAQPQPGALPDAHRCRAAGSSGAARARPGRDRLPATVARRARHRIGITAPHRRARHAVPPLGLLEACAPPDCPGDFLERPLRAAPHDQRLLPMGRAGAAAARPVSAARRRRRRLARLQAGRLLPWARPPAGSRRGPDRRRAARGVTVDLVEAAGGAAGGAAVGALELRPARARAGLARTRHQRGIRPPAGKQRGRGPTIGGRRRTATATGPR